MKTLSIFVIAILLCLQAHADLELDQGWNLISINTIPPDTRIEIVLKSIEHAVESVWAYDGHQWKMYAPGNPLLTDLFEMVPGRGYWIKLNQPAVLQVPGDIT